MRLLELKTTVWISLHKALTVTPSNENVLGKQEMSLDADVEREEKLTCADVCSLPTKRSLAFPLNYVELEFERKWNEAELRKNVTRLDGLSTEEEHVRTGGSKMVAMARTRERALVLRLNGQEKATME